MELTFRALRCVRAPLDAARVVVGVACTVPVPAELDRCLASVAQQTFPGLGVVLLLDGLGAGDAACSLQLPAALAGRTWVLAANCGTPARARNAIIEFVEHHLPAVRWIARLDADDTFASPSAVAAAVAVGDSQGATAVLGGNRVLSRGGDVLRENPATDTLRDRAWLVERLGAMAAGTAENEFPSCNLVVRAGAGLRYPDMRSAEDHWLVAELLFHRPDKVAILEAPLLVDYRLDGAVTKDARKSSRHARVRGALAAAARTWAVALDLPGTVLGLGQEGIVRLHDGRIHKHFYPGVLEEPAIRWLGEAVPGFEGAPAACFERDAKTGGWVASYPHEPTTEFTQPDPEAVRQFLRASLASELVCANVKRSNFRVRDDGSLLYIDIGSWIIPMDVSYFRDAAARLYSIGVLGASDDELLRRPADHGRPEVWSELHGFAAFYGEVVAEPIRARWKTASLPESPLPARRADVSLLIKACAMDARDLRAQVLHLVDQLSTPTDFAERILVIDPFPGPFLRAHSNGDLDAVRAIGEDLRRVGVVDRVLVGPTDADEILATNRRWFGVEATHTHATDGVPVTPQVWAFDQVHTRYMLQADVDVLVGRRRLDHDYLGDMLRACEAPDVVGVAFNIPQSGESRPYDAPAGEFKPEVRLGLLDLPRVTALRPLPANVENGRLTTAWYRALHAVQRARGLRTVRGGNPDSFYIHPPNARKADGDALGRVRDLVSQGLVPDDQLGRWDLEAPPTSWRYPPRGERVVVLARGRNTSPEKVRRFAAGLAIQRDQDFGVVVVDDASDDLSPSGLRRTLGWLGDRLTLVRNASARGRTRNARFAVGEVCTNPDAMILVVDLDDALAHPEAVGEVARLGVEGHDVVLAAPFRPDAPTHVYAPDFERARQTFGGDVWIHLRAFRKALYDGLPDALFKLDGRWLEALDDYATMVPLVERARSPVYVPRYRYWHERATVLDAEGIRRRDETILRLLAKRPDGEDQ